MNVSFVFWTFCSIFEFLATYETTFDPQKGQNKLENRTKRSKNERNVLFTDKKERREQNVLFKRTEKNVENESFFKKKRKKRENEMFFWKERMPNPGMQPVILFSTFTDFRSRDFGL